MKIELKLKHGVWICNSIVWIKYGVIPDILRAIRHGVNAISGALNSLESGIDDITNGVSITNANIKYNAASVFNASDAGLIKIICTGLLILFILRKFMPVIMARSRKSAAKAKSAKSAAKTKPTKTDAFKAWYDEYGKNYKTKKEAKKHFDEWYMWEYGKAE